MVKYECPCEGATCDEFEIPAVEFVNCDVEFGEERSQICDILVALEDPENPGEALGWPTAQTAEAILASEAIEGLTEASWVKAHMVLTHMYYECLVPYNVCRKTGCAVSTNTNTCHISMYFQSAYSWCISINFMGAITNSNVINRYTLMDKERIYGRMQRNQKKLNNDMIHLALNMPVRLNNCIKCKDKQKVSVTTIEV